MVCPPCLQIAGTQCGKCYTGMLQSKSAAVVCTCKHGFLSSRTTRLNIQKFNKVLALRLVFCTDLRRNSGFCCIRH